MDEPVLDIHIRDGDPLFERAVELATEVVAALVYGVMEPAGPTTVSMPTLSSVVEEIDRFPDARLLGMFVFALGHGTSNILRVFARERGRSVDALLQEFLLRPVQ